MYLNCPRCRLAIAQTARSRALAHCPRCLGRADTRVEMFASTLRAEQLYADGAPSADAGVGAEAPRTMRHPTPATLAWRGAFSGALRKPRTVIDREQ